MKLLDLFCGAGGAAMGYSQAGFTEIVGVDIEPQPNYPFEFVQGDVMSIRKQRSDIVWTDFDLIHASPPCQEYSRAMRHLAHPQPKLIDPVRVLLVAVGMPWVIENVPGAPLPDGDTLFGDHGVMLCGTEFGLPVYRHRLFETSFPIPRQGNCNHSIPAMNPHNQAGRDRIYDNHGRGDPEKPWREEMGVGWMTKYEGREAIPPAYTKFIGEQFISQQVAV